jgi:putative transcriptional regulator
MAYAYRVFGILLSSKKARIMKNTLKVERAILNLTQEDLANRIGVSRQTINSIESNRYVPSTVLSLKLSEVFGKPVNDFFSLGEDD